VKCEPMAVCCDCLLYEPRVRYVRPTAVWCGLAFVLSTRRNNNEATTSDARRLVTVAAAATTATALIAGTWLWRLDVNKKQGNLPVAVNGLWRTVGGRRAWKQRVHCLRVLIYGDAGGQHFTWGSSSALTDRSVGGSTCFQCVIMPAGYTGVSSFRAGSFSLSAGVLDTTTRVQCIVYSPVTLHALLHGWPCDSHRRQNYEYRIMILVYNTCIPVVEIHDIIVTIYKLSLFLKSMILLL